MSDLNDYQIIQVGDLPVAETLEGLNILGFDSTNNRAVRALMTLLQGLDGKPVELQKTATHLQWRVQGGTWANLVALDEIKGAPGDNISLQKTATHIQWRLGAGTWADLVALVELKGDTGANIELQKSDTHVQWRVAGTSTWNNLILIEDLKVKGDKGDPNTLSIGTVQGGASAGASITGTAPNQTLNLTLPKGETGANIELQKSATHVQWRVQGTSTWNNLILIDDLKVKGDTGANIELQKSTTHVQWRVVGTSTWTNLVALSELKGEKGDAPVKGVDYFDGKNPVMTIGTITTVASNAQADATVVADGVDAEGKPKFKLNLWLPKGVDGEGAGDMLKSVYDPTGKNTDVFGYVDNKVKTDVPVNAKFTDTTYEEITEAEINTGTASTLRTITARRVTFILSKVSTLISNAISALTKNDVGLGNVDNTSDVNKPVSTAQQTAIDSGVAEAKTYADGKFALAIPLTQKGAASGVAELDSSGKVLSSQLPSYVDDVLSYTTQSNFPTIGESGKIYIAEDTNKTYRWAGGYYVEISPSIALGETSATAYRGDRGKVAYDHSQVAHAPANAQKNSDITKAEIEAKLTGDINTHTHNQYIESSKFQVVTSLPASPVSGTFYFVKE